MSRVANIEPVRSRGAQWPRAAGLVLLVCTTACAGGAAQPGRWQYFRSPTLDYRELPRSADGDVLGAHQQAPDDWVDAAVTNEHLPPGWAIVDGEVVFLPERRAAGRGAYIDLARCPEELGAPPEELALADPGAEPASAEPPSPAWYSCPE